MPANDGNDAQLFHQDFKNRKFTSKKNTRKPSLYIVPSTLATFLGDCEFSAGCYALTVSNSGLLFITSAVTGFPNMSKFVPTDANNGEWTIHPVIWHRWLEETWSNYPQWFSFTGKPRSTSSDSGKEGQFNKSWWSRNCGLTLQATHHRAALTTTTDDFSVWTLSQFKTRRNHSTAGNVLALFHNIPDKITMSRD